MPTLESQVGEDEDGRSGRGGGVAQGGARHMGTPVERGLQRVMQLRLAHTVAVGGKVWPARGGVLGEALGGTVNKGGR